MDIRPPYVIIGNGIAGITAAEILRAFDASCALTIVADDPFPVYYRPALKDFLGGRLAEEKLWARPATFYQEQHVRFIPGRAVSINPQQHIVQLHNGQTIQYHKLLLANGGRSRSLTCPGLNLAGVSTLRTVADYQEILRRLENVKRVVVCGSGTLALESAETLRHSGYQVTHLLRGQMLWSEVLDPVASDMVLQEERRDGVDVRTGEEIAEIVGREGQVCAVITTRGERIPCELVLIAVGIEPLTDFIRSSGIACGRGVQVDSCMRTSSPDIYAAGDVIETTDTLTGRTRVLGQWFPAIQQAQIAAYEMLNVHATSTPFGQFYNATFLYGLDFVSIGLTSTPAASGFSELIAEPGPRSYRKAIFYNGHIVGALLLGDRRQALAFKRAIDHQVNLLAIARYLFSEDFDLDAWLNQQQAPAPILSLESKKLSTIPAREYNGTGETDSSSLPLKDVDAYFVPIPHARVHVFATETQVNRNDETLVITIGRQAGVVWTLEHSSISRLHAEITRMNDVYLLRDKGSSNGTFVNASPLAPENVYQLRHCDVVRFGDVQFRFELRPRTSSGKLSAAAPSRSMAHLQGTELHTNNARLIPDSLLRTLPDTPALVQAEPDRAPAVLPLEYGRRYLLGRDQQNDVVFTDTSISRKHAEIFSASDGFYIRDLNSSYGVFVNKVKIQNAFHIAHGDRIVLGNILLYFSHLQNNSLREAASHTSLATLAVSSSQDLTTKMSTSRISPGTQEPIVTGLEHRRNIVPLKPEHLTFEIDMCIGCNRCMDACPLPSSSLISIAALNYATVTESIAPEVTRFTHECIMCGSCVPVCPVDNHRDLLMLSLKQRLEVSWQGRPDPQRLVQVIPAGWSETLLIQRLREQIFLRDPQQVPDTYLLHLALLSERVILAPGEQLLREGEYGRDLYLLLDGQLGLTTTDQGSSELPVAILRRGEYVGEDGMLTGHPYKVSARAQKPTLLLKIPEQVMQHLMELVPAVPQHFERFKHTHILLAILRRMGMFEGVSDADLHALIQVIPIRHYERSERLFAEDKRGRPSREALHILLEGFVKVARQTPRGGERIIAYRQGGDYFAGGLDLLGDGQAVTVTTINRCRVAEVPRQAVLALFQRYPQVQQRFAWRLQEYIEAAASTRDHALPNGSIPADPGVQAGLHSLVSDGVVEGTEVLVIDLDKCIHCNECENACERRHGHSRMNRKGIVVGNISITTTCRQCQDPVCMLCSRAGIARLPNGEVYITESCIGCGICAERCPYGAISIAQIEDESPAQNTWERFSALITGSSRKERGRRTLPMVSPSVAGGSLVASGPLDAFPERNGYDELRKKIAIKCDLCAGYSNQACVQACPAGAAFRVQPTTFFGSTEEILQRRAN
jgi:NADPH-dependent 2,4-dienoyl-CoA reductase/sulfur reductase-like enzyme/pSer/pThr/pTyr-binding forkhead associated (FHA) protein/CRP-like cAMP-binding protein